MVTAASGIKTVDEVDRAGVRVVGIANTTTIRAAGRTLKNTTAIAAASIDDAIAMMPGGKADAFALSRDSLPAFVAKFPGSRIVEGGFQYTVVAIAVPKGRPEALAYVTEFLEKAKASGAVRRASTAPACRIWRSRRSTPLSFRGAPIARSRRSTCASRPTGDSVGVWLPGSPLRGAPE